MSPGETQVAVIAPRVVTESAWSRRIPGVLMPLRACSVRAFEPATFLVSEVEYLIRVRFVPV